MKLFCHLFGHKNPQRTGSASEYTRMQAEFRSTSGDGREEWYLRTACPRCGIEYTAGVVLGPILTPETRALLRPPITNDMVSRFLGWPLPKSFAPDCGISFDGRKDDQWNKNKTWPIGTNLLNADEAKDMLRHVLGG